MNMNDLQQENGIETRIRVTGEVFKKDGIIISLRCLHQI